ncbi:MAG: hypothetical protein R3C28_22965 [Pirellulaceae bacterium]
MDVNNDGFIVPFDAILIINELNGPQYSDDTTGQLDTPPNPRPAFLRSTMTLCMLIDVIMNINYLNANPAAGVAAVADLPEGESTSNSTKKMNRPLIVISLRPSYRKMSNATQLPQWIWHLPISTPIHSPANVRSGCLNNHDAIPLRLERFD